MEIVRANRRGRLAYDSFSGLYDVIHPNPKWYSTEIAVYRFSDQRRFELSRLVMPEGAKGAISVFEPGEVTESFSFGFDRSGLLAFRDKERGHFTGDDPNFREQSGPLITWALNCYFQGQYEPPPEAVLEKIKEVGSSQN